MGSPTATASYEVDITYCNDVVFNHRHETAIDATTEYAEMIHEAIEPTVTKVEANHVRMVTLQILREEEVIRTLNSGVFECEHDTTTRKETE